MTKHTIDRGDLATPERRTEIIAGYREMADWLEANPDVPLASFSGYSLSITLQSHHVGDDPIASSPRRLAKVMARGGKVEKRAYDFLTTFDLRRVFSGGAAYTFSFDRSEICQPVIKGQREKTEEVPVDRERAAELQAELDAMETREVVVGHEPIIVYDCAPLLRS